MDNTIDRDIIRNHIDAIILRLLTERDRYGYEICKEVASRSGGAYELKEPSLYTALRRLAAGGQVSSYWGDGASQGARRKYYRITKSGRAWFKHTLAEWRSIKQLMDKLIGEEA
ncbi:MAG: PadR family transcriptional regulator [Spirochaetaceae bacterium]|jgi:PadR family transcriptional regulator PadR|nr:PadR family transcriptional regulator [Spirochaetaceae bacterium]